MIRCGDGWAVREVTGINFRPNRLFEEYGVEDPRITPLNGRFSITYVAILWHGPANYTEEWSERSGAEAEIDFHTSGLDADRFPLPIETARRRDAGHRHAAHERVRIAARLRELSGCDQTVVIAISGYTSEVYQARGRELGIVHYVIKPADLCEVHELKRLVAPKKPHALGKLIQRMGTVIGRRGASLGPWGGCGRK